MSDKMREEFEKEYGRIYLQKEADGSYAGFRAKVAWEYWQKSRAALVVKLPPTCCRTLIFEMEDTLEVGMEHGEYYEPEDIKESLGDAGISYE